MLEPRFHHIAPGQWINDPVGLHRLNGVWVLHDQRASALGDPAIGWGRATSTDLLHWNDERMVIPPGADEWIYSGSVLQEEARTRAYFTLHRPSSGLQAQGEARWGGTWQRVPGDRVAARAESRDPYVFRWEDEWRMLLAQPPPWGDPMRHPARLMLLGSPDLENWREIAPVGPASTLGEMFETPLLRRIPVADEAAEDWPWLLAVGVVDRREGRTVCGTRAWFGRFDGSRFEEASSAFQLDHGPDFYAPALWAGTADDEVVATAWTNSWSYARLLPSRGWSGGAHALPRRLSAARDARTGYCLRQQPAALPIGGPPRSIAAERNMVGVRALISLSGRGAVRLGDLRLHLQPGRFELVRECELAPLTTAGFAGRWAAPCQASTVHLLLDGCVAEVFAEDGSAWMSALSLRDESHQLEVEGDLAVTMRPIG
jgi:sucrose-6-phosphate hydrolase SacC (GH32 family)